MNKNKRIFTTLLFIFLFISSVIIPLLMVPAILVVQGTSYTTPANNSTFTMGKNFTFGGVMVNDTELWMNREYCGIPPQRNEYGIFTPDWWNTSWPYRRLILINNTWNNETLTDFPIMVSVSLFQVLFISI